MDLQHCGHHPGTFLRGLQREHQPDNHTHQISAPPPPFGHGPLDLPQRRSLRFTCNGFDRRRRRGTTLTRFLADGWSVREHSTWPRLHRSDRARPGNRLAQMSSLCTMDRCTAELFRQHPRRRNAPAFLCLPGRPILSPSGGQLVEGDSSRALCRLEGCWCSHTSDDPIGDVRSFQRLRKSTTPVFNF